MAAGRPSPAILNSALTDWLQRSAQLRDDGKMGEAIDLLEQAVAIGEETSAICKELARLSLTVNEVRAFSNWCHEAMRLDPADPEPHLMIARVLVDNQRWQEASEALNAALARRLPDAERREAETLRDRADASIAAHRLAHPGFSNI